MSWGAIWMEGIVIFHNILLGNIHLKTLISKHFFWHLFRNTYFDKIIPGLTPLASNLFLRTILLFDGQFYIFTDNFIFAWTILWRFGGCSPNGFFPLSAKNFPSQKFVKGMRPIISKYLFQNIFFWTFFLTFVSEHLF